MQVSGSWLGTNDKFVFGSDYETNNSVDIRESDLFTKDEAEAVKAECEAYAAWAGHDHITFSIGEHEVAAPKYAIRIRKSWASNSKGDHMSGVTFYVANIESWLHDRWPEVEDVPAECLYEDEHEAVAEALAIAESVKDDDYYGDCIIDVEEVYNYIR